MRMPEVLKLTGLSKSSIYDRIKAGQFPNSVPLGGRSVAWVAHEIEQWIDSQIAQRDTVIE
ncbi:transcriptional regulator [Vibrio breoganii ZF-55]|nr:transcriptional regulator [Vibrio breoganii ZF-55]